MCTAELRSESGTGGGGGDVERWEHTGREKIRAASQQSVYCFILLLLFL